MKNWLGIVSLLVVAHLTLPSVQAVEFFDITSPTIKKLNLVIQTKEPSAKTTKMADDLKRLLGKTLLFTIVGNPSQAEFSVVLEGKVESGQLLFTIQEENQSGSFKPLVLGTRLRSQDDQYLFLKVAQIGNRVIKQLFGLNGSLGSQLVWSVSRKDESTRGLHIGDFGVDNNKQLTYNLFSNFGASWNPAHDTILYTAHTDLGTQLFVQRTNPIRAKQVLVYENDGRSSSAFWGPDGSVFLSLFVANSNTDIFQFSIGNDPYAAANPSMKQVKKLTRNRAIETEPAISPDGKQMAYISDRTGSPQIYIMDLASNKEQRITRNGRYNASPSWSPNGRYLAYFGLREKDASIFRLNVSTGEESRLTPTRLKAEAPTWSPDGSMIAFAGDDGSEVKKVYYMLSTGGEVARFTNSGPDVEETDPSWSPGLQ